MSAHAQTTKVPFLKDKNLYAEMVGTFLLVFLSLITHYLIAPDSAVGMFTYIIGVILLAHCIVGISGCHINPAVSIGATLNHEITWGDCIRYIVGQVIGALLAGLLLFGIFKLGHEPIHAELVHTADLNTSENIPFMLLVEFGLVFVFVLLVLGAVGTFERTKLGGLIVGGTLVMEHLFGILIHGASVNPAIPLGSLFIADDVGMALANVWLYIVPAVLAALAAGFVGKKLFAHLHHSKPGQFTGHNVDDEIHEVHGEAHH